MYPPIVLPCKTAIAPFVPAYALLDKLSRQATGEILAADKLEEFDESTVLCILKFPLEENVGAERICCSN